MAQLRASGSLIAVMASVLSFGCGESSRSAVAPDGVTVTTSVGNPATAAALGVEAATRPLSDSRPFQAVCEANGGSFSASSVLVCRFPGSLGSGVQIPRVLSTICEQVYGGVFAIVGSEPGDAQTTTFCEVF